MIELRGVTKQFAGTVVLPPLDLSVAAGRTTVLLGPSGCGKSTVLRLMVGLIRPDGGEVLFEGKPVTPEAAHSVRRRVGFMVQDGGLFPHLTARDNAALMARHLRWDAGRINSRLSELADLARLPAGLLGRYPGQLSGGQKQRVALMRALMLDPPAVLLDEPMGALDPMVRSELQADLRRAFRDLGKTVVLVTHDLGEAGYMGDELVLLKAGRVVQRGTLGEFVRSPGDPFVTQFVNAQRWPEV